MPERIYLDNAATSWPKPEAVYAATDAYQRGVGAAAGRGAYATACAADRVVERARVAVARLLGESDPRRVAFAASGTDALCTALFGLLRGGEHVVTTVVDHNAVLRPLTALAEGERDRPIEVTHVGCDAEGFVDPGAIAAALRPDTKLVAVTHASNVTGAVQPIEAIAEAVHQSGASLLVDAAQTLGRWPVDVRTLGADLIAAPGHKGLLGPLGTGVLWVREGTDQGLRPLRHGGARGDSASSTQPEAMPDKLEAGNLNVPGLAGLAAGVEHVLEVGVETLRGRVGDRVEQLSRDLAAVAGVRRFGPADRERQAGVVAFRIEGYDPHEAAALLESVAGVECRAGLHCAPRLHEALGTGGAVRFSPGPATTADQVEAAVAAVRTLVAQPTAAV